MTVKVAHILVKHVQSRRPFVKWKNGGEVVTRSVKDAKKSLKKVLKQLEHARRRAEQRREEDPEKSAEEAVLEKFFEIAADVSDCGSAKDGGILDDFEIGCVPPIMHPQFEEACKALKVNQLSDIVETKSGVHLIYRLE